ncbi:NAD-dependent epimerase/dehydratase family protein [Hamadaea tsunoensis]|uniref:NAD-dependent epimerase/dehydratase family protein n=1 Tax=Hamadaea tsunoensis TaxID=53368 RepID=UPI001B7FCE1E|nr:NAD(P)-dependent oxidoreductase [Hamadaea tsunoensis]
MNTQPMGMNTNQTVIVAGASGVFGRHVVRTLRAAGHTVLGLGRREGTEIRADLLDRAALLRAADGVRADVVVHAATALSKPPMSHKGMYGTDDLRVAGTRNLIELAGVVGARRWIGENIVFGYGYKDFGGRVLTEADPFGGTDPDAGLARHLEGMRVKENLPVEAGLDAVSLRFGLFYGPGGATESLVAMLRKRQLPAFDDHGRVLPWINLIDAANAVAAAIEHGRGGEAYNIVDESHLGFGGAVRTVAAAYGTPKPFTMPALFTRALPYLRSMLTTNITADTAKARRELRWAPVYPTLPDGLEH